MFRRTDDRSIRIAKIGRCREGIVIEGGCEVIDDPHDLALFGKACLYFALKNGNASDLLFQMNKREVPIGICIVCSHFQPADLVTADTNERTVLTEKVSQCADAIAVARRRQKGTSHRDIGPYDLSVPQIFAVFNFECRDLLPQGIFPANKTVLDVRDSGRVLSGRLTDPEQSGVSFLFGP